MTEFRTRHVGLSAFLRYCLGSDAHLGTLALERGFEFVFSDNGKCRTLADQFFSAEGAAVTDARQLLECVREMRISTGKAKEQGCWDRATDFQEEHCSLDMKT